MDLQPIGIVAQGNLFFVIEEDGHVEKTDESDGAPNESRSGRGGSGCIRVYVTDTEPSTPAATRQSAGYDTLPVKSSTSLPGTSWHGRTGCPPCKCRRG